MPQFEATLNRQFDSVSINGSAGTHFRRADRHHARDCLRSRRPRAARRMNESWKGDCEVSHAPATMVSRAGRINFPASTFESRDSQIASRVSTKPRGNRSRRDSCRQGRRHPCRGCRRRQVMGIAKGLSSTADRPASACIPRQDGWCSREDNSGLRARTRSFPFDSPVHTRPA
jgi:hypothetical protein